MSIKLQNQAAAQLRATIVDELIPLAAQCPKNLKIYIEHSQSENSYLIEWQMLGSDSFYYARDTDHEVLDTVTTLVDVANALRGVLN